MTNRRKKKICFLNLRKKIFTTKIKLRIKRPRNCFHFNRILTYKSVFPLSTLFSRNFGENLKAYFFKRYLSWPTEEHMQYICFVLVRVKGFMSVSGRGVQKAVHLIKSNILQFVPLSSMQRISVRIVRLHCNPCTCTQGWEFPTKK